MENKDTKIDVYNSKDIQEWCKKYNKTQEQYYEQLKEVWNILAGFGGRKLS